MSIKLIKFGAVWCGPCRALQPVWDNLVDNNPGVEFVAVDIDDEPALAQKYKISAVPTILFLRGGMVVDHMVGLHKEADIKAKLEFVKQG